MKINWRKLLWNFTGLIQLILLIWWASIGFLGVVAVIQENIHGSLVIFSYSAVPIPIWFLMRKIRRPFKSRYSLFTTLNFTSLAKYFLEKHPIINSFVDQDDKISKV